MGILSLFLVTAALSQAGDHTGAPQRPQAPPLVPCGFFPGDEKPENAHDLNQLARFLSKVLPLVHGNAEGKSLRAASQKAMKEHDKAYRREAEKYLGEIWALGVLPVGVKDMIYEGDIEIQKARKAFLELALSCSDLKEKVVELRVAIRAQLEPLSLLQEKKNRTPEEDEEIERILGKINEIFDEQVRVSAVFEEALDSRKSEKSLFREFPKVREFFKKNSKDIESFRIRSNRLRKLTVAYQTHRQAQEVRASAIKLHQQEELIFLLMFSRLPRDVRIAVGYEGNDIKTVRFLQVGEGQPGGKIIPFEYHDEEKALGKEMDRVFGVRKPLLYRWVACE